MHCGCMRNDWLDLTRVSMQLLVVNCMTSAHSVSRVVGVCRGRREGWQMRPRRCRRGGGTALVVPLHERHDECGAEGLENTEQE